MINWRTGLAGLNGASKYLNMAFSYQYSLTSEAPPVVVTPGKATRGAKITGSGDRRLLSGSSKRRVL